MKTRKRSFWTYKEKNQEFEPQTERNDECGRMKFCSSLAWVRTATIDSTRNLAPVMCKFICGNVDSNQLLTIHWFYLCCFVPKDSEQADFSLLSVSIHIRCKSFDRTEYISGFALFKLYMCRFNECPLYEIGIICSKNWFCCCRKSKNCWEKNQDEQ